MVAHLGRTCQSATAKIGKVLWDQVHQRRLEHLRESEDGAKRRVRRMPRPRFALFILLVRVASETSAVGDVFLTQTGTLTRGTKRGRESLRVRPPLGFNLFVPSRHLLSVVSADMSHGLIGMA